MFRTLLIANRGEIACRIARTARRMGIRAIAVYSDADAGALHTRLADGAVRIGPPSVRASYLNVGALLRAAQEQGAEAIHPGYGFLSESPDFAESCAAAELAFVGPSAAAMRAMAGKDEAKALMQRAGVPVLPGYPGESQADEVLAAEARRIGFPLLVKAVAGGGGKGMRIVPDPAAMPAALAAARGEAERAFGNGRVMLERYLEHARHVEVQIVADRHGSVVQLLERDCSLQRRYQKIVEEAPAPRLSAGLRERLHAAAVAAARAVDYENAGTVEFVVQEEEFFFLEMNTRLQVEHPVTEAILGIDLVEWQLRVAAGEPLPARQEEIRPRGHAFEARVYAEDPRQGFLPSAGRLRGLHWPQGVRIDAAVVQGDRVATDYDALLAKLIVHGTDRAAALAALRRALRACRIEGVRTNLAALIALAEDGEVAAGRLSTRLIDSRGAALLRDPVIRSRRAAALAALAVLAPEESGPRSPWDSRDGWAPGARRPPRLRLQAEQQAARVVEARRLGTGWRIAVECLPESPARRDDDPPERRAAPRTMLAEAVHGDGPMVSARIDGDPAQATVRILDEGLEVWLDGEWHRFVCVADGERPLASSLDTLLRAPMPGVVLALHVQPRQRVREGDVIVELHSEAGSD